MTVSAALGAFLVPWSANAVGEGAVALLDGLGASFIVSKKENSVSVITYDWKPPEETCKTLTDAGFQVDRVVNYGIDGDKPSTMTFSNCLSKN